MKQVSKPIWFPALSKELLTEPELYVTPVVVLSKENVYGFPQPVSGVFIGLLSKGCVQPPSAKKQKLPSESPLQSSCVFELIISASIGNDLATVTFAVFEHPLASLKKNS